ncbi:MAG: hypothetical protein FWC20_06665 [Oscillospiraceae bacterium]|nr:hypothetical protein [Oscillospiraceae bacterium]MCL2279072.1 hypothetical protein [Oscillospiraceae bacterium]
MEKKLCSKLCQITDRKLEHKHTVLIASLLIILKFIIVMGHRTVIMPHAYHDDVLFFSLASSITEGNWLGPYNQLTLAKGVFFPLWLAFLNAFSIPLLIGNQALYTLACLFFVYSLRPILKSKIAQLICFAFLLYNPITLGEMQMLRILRDGIYHSLVMFVFAGFIGMFLYRDDVKKMRIFSLICGLNFAFAWHTREDTFFVLPFVIAASVAIMLFSLFENKDKKTIKQVILQKTFIRKVLFIALPFLFIFASNQIVAGINNAWYGRHVVNDFRSSCFQSAYGALSRIAHDEFYFQIPVPEDARMRAYEVSPAFNELRQFLDDDGSQTWWKVLGGPRNDFYGGWFFWALRNAVAEAGYYEHPLYAREFYERLAREINDAIDEGLLPAQAGRRSTLAPPFTRRHIVPTLEATVEAIKFVSNFERFYISFTHQQQEPHFGAHYAQRIRNMEIYTHQLSSYNSHETNAYSRFNMFKFRISNWILNIYRFISPPLTSLSLLTLLLLTISTIRSLVKKSAPLFYREVIVLWGLLLIFILRAFMVAFVHISSFFAISHHYLATNYFTLIAFNVIAIVCLITYVKSMVARSIVKRNAAI